MRADVKERWFPRIALRTPPGPLHEDMTLNQKRARFALLVHYMSARELGEWASEIEGEYFELKRELFGGAK